LYGVKFLSTEILRTLDLKTLGPLKDAAAHVLSQELATDRYHALGTPSELIPSLIPEGATVLSLLKLIICDAGVSFNLFATLLSKVALALMEGHATGILSTFSLIVYRANAPADVAGDAERVKILNWLILAAVLVIGALEALIATDYQRVAALLSDVFMLLSHLLGHRGYSLSSEPELYGSAGTPQHRRILIEPVPRQHRLRCKEAGSRL
jgi:hypothetical protein